MLGIRPLLAWLLPAAVIGGRSPGSPVFLPEIAKFLCDSCDATDFTTEHFSRALQSLASTQNALKSVDGLTHQFKNAFTDYSTLLARYRTFKRKRKKSAKEATKLYEYVNTMERTFQAAEVLQSSAEDDLDRRRELWRLCGLQEIKRVTLQCMKFKCSMTVLRPLEETADPSKRYKPGEVVVAISDEKSMKLPSILKLLRKKEKVLSLRAVGLVNEETSVQPALFELAKQALLELKEYILPFCPAGNDSINATEPGQDWNSTDRYVRFMGYSIGGGVSALSTMILDGSLPLRDEELKELTGLCKDRVKGVCIGPPPAVSRSVVSRNVMTIICGDDCVPRATYDTIEHFKERVLDGLRKGAGRRGIGGLGYKLGPGLLGDISAVAGKLRNTPVCRKPLIVSQGRV